MTPNGKKKRRDVGGLKMSNSQQQSLFLTKASYVKGATFSPCRLYRYSLHRQWYNGKPYCCFICLNPSTADENHDDPTVRRCINYTKIWGYGGIIMLNLFAFRATDPKEMKAQEDPIGPDNDRNIRNFCRQAGLIVAAWGNDGVYKNRGKQVIKLLKNDKLCYLRLTNSGEPAHPLYLPKNLEPIPWNLINND